MKAGYAGEDTPKAVFPSAVGWLERGGDVEMKEAKGSKRGSKSKGAAGDAAAARRRRRRHERNTTSAT